MRPAPAAVRTGERSPYLTFRRPAQPNGHLSLAAYLLRDEGRRCHGVRVTLRRMRTLTIRTDAEVEHALEALTRGGLTRSEVARAAILEAERAHRRAQLRAEAESLRNDPQDVAASRALAAEMDALRAW